jgi:hypothetical protein
MFMIPMEMMHFQVREFGTVCRNIESGLASPVDLCYTSSFMLASFKESRPVIPDPIYIQYLPLFAFNMNLQLSEGEAKPTPGNSAENARCATKRVNFFQMRIELEALITIVIYSFHTNYAFHPNYLFD